MLALSLVDLGEDLLVLGEAIRITVREGEPIVDRHLEDAADTFRETRGDAVPVLDGGLQIGALGQVVSLAAVQDLDIHPTPPPENGRRHSSTGY